MGVGTWCSIVKVPTESNVAAGNPRSVASPSSTWTLVPGKRRVRASTASGSDSIADSRVTRCRSHSVAALATFGDEMLELGPLGRRAGTRAELEHLVAERRERGERGKDVVVEVLGPPGTRAQPLVVLVHPGNVRSRSSRTKNVG
jgi:hypothetical protein